MAGVERGIPRYLEAVLDFLGIFASSLAARARAFTDQAWLKRRQPIG